MRSYCQLAAKEVLQQACHLGGLTAVKPLGGLADDMPHAADFLAARHTRGLTAPSPPEGGA